MMDKIQPLNLLKALLISFLFYFPSNAHLSAQTVLSFDFDCGGANFGEGRLGLSPSGLVCYELDFSTGFTQSYLWDGTEWLTRVLLCEDVTAAVVPTLISSTLAVDENIIAAVDGNAVFACSTSNIQYRTIPTLDQWGIMILALLLLIIGVNGYKRLVYSGYKSY